MIAYLLKSILCSALLFLFYILVLEKEKIHRFNRWYLLFSLVLALSFPLISFYTTIDPVVLPSNNFFTTIILPDSTPNNLPVPQENRVDIYPLILLILYGLVTFVLLLRFCLNIYRLIVKAKQNRRVHYQDATLVLLKEKTVTYTFFNTIFVNEEEYENGALKKEIMIHELTHVRERHSLDVLLIELLRVIMWFNPILYFYRKAIQLNHEFLADQAVITTLNNTTGYQYLLLENVSGAGRLLLTSRFNFLITKKRLTMMTKKTPPGIAALKKLALLPFLAILVFAFGNKMHAQQTPTPVPKVMPQPESTVEGVSTDLLKEYDAIIEKFKKDGKGWVLRLSSSKEDRDRLEIIFRQMSKDQQRKQIIGFLPPSRPLPRIVPTAKQLKDFSAPSEYGVWINERKVANSELANYKPSDFEQVFISKLYGAARTSVSYNYQVNLMTTAFYRKYREEALANKHSNMTVMLERE